MVGQINLGTKVGNLIKSMAERADINVIVELGTWNGMGSTRCVIEAIKNHPEKRFYSVELYENLYKQSIANLGELAKHVKLLRGTIVGLKDLNWFDHQLIHDAIRTGRNINGIHAEHANIWFSQDCEEIETAPNILSQLPSQIDFLILDGGEYSTYPEWLILKDRSRVIFLDDTKLLKCNRIRKEIIESKLYKTVLDEQNDRFGYSLFEKV